MSHEILTPVQQNGPVDTTAAGEKTGVTTPFHKEIFAENKVEKNILPQQIEPHNVIQPAARPGGGPAPRPEPPRPAPAPPRPEPRPPRPEPQPPRPEPRPPRPEPRPPRPEPQPPRPEPRPPRPEPRPPRPEPQPPKPEPRPPKPEPRPPKPEPQPPKPEPRPPKPEPRPPKPEPQPPKPEPRPPKPEPRPPKPEPQPPKPEPRPPKPEPHPPKPEPRPPKPEPHPPKPEPRPPKPEPRPPKPEPHPPKPEPHPPKPEPQPPKPEPRPPRPEPHPPKPEPHPPRPEPPHPRPPHPEPRPEPPRPPRPEPHPEPRPPRPEPPRPEPPHEHPHPPHPTDHHPYHDGEWNRPPRGEHWGWEDHDRFKRGWDPWFFEHSPNYERWNPVIQAEAREIANLLDSGNTAAAMNLLNAELYDLRYDRYAQNQLLREIEERERFHRLHLDRWNPDTGTWGNIEVTPPPPVPLPPTDPMPPAPEPPAPIPVPTPDANDPWMQLEGTVVSSLMDAGDSQAAATRLKSDLYALRGNLEAQNSLLDLVNSEDRKGTGTDLRIGNWNPDTGTYDSIEVLPALSDPGSGIPLDTYPKSDAEQPDGVIDTTKSNDATDPWQHQEIAVIAAYLDAGDTVSAATKLTSDLQMLKGDMDSQNQLLAEIAANHQAGSGTDLVLGPWDPNTGSYTTIEVLPAGSDPGSGIKIKTYPGSSN